jgi:hypothetical protein
MGGERSYLGSTYRQESCNWVKNLREASAQTSLEDFVSRLEAVTFSRLSLQ